MASSEFILQFRTAHSDQPVPKTRQPLAQAGLIELQRYEFRHPNLLLQPDSQLISQEQLASEVKSNYTGLTMVETKCNHVDRAQPVAAQDSGSSHKLGSDHWQALIALHRTLLYEHHDFFLASQHPFASPTLCRLVDKYNSMSARMWKHGTYSFLEPLRRCLPESIDYMLAFIYLAYQMMALLYGTMPAFEDTWIECLGDLGRYRLTIEEKDVRKRETWQGVAWPCYTKAADQDPTYVRLCHFQQAGLPNSTLQRIERFLSACESILTLLDLILGRAVATYSHADIAGWFDYGIDDNALRQVLLSQVGKTGTCDFAPHLQKPTPFEDRQELVSPKISRRGDWLRHRISNFHKTLSDSISRFDRTISNGYKSWPPNFLLQTISILQNWQLSVAVLLFASHLSPASAYDTSDTPQKQAPIFVKESPLDYALDGLILVYLAAAGFASLSRSKRNLRMRLFRISYIMTVFLGYFWLIVYRDDFSAPGTSIRKTVLKIWFAGGVHTRIQYCHDFGSRRRHITTSLILTALYGAFMLKFPSISPLYSLPPFASAVAMTALLHHEYRELVNQPRRPLDDEEQGH